MIYRFIVRPEAEIEIDDSYNWYEDQSVGLGMDFLLAVQASIDRISANPYAYQIVHRKKRRAVLRTYPHSIYFVISENEIAITACVHHKRDPKVWRSRR
jgi:plasmid stabilization system protein ParE